MEKTTHPLSQRPKHRLTWADWKDAWNGTAYPALLPGLLHVSMDVPCDNTEEWRERICLLLEVADGHRDDTAFPDRDLRKVAQKAFKILCERVFKDHRESYENEPSWMKIVRDPVVLAKIIWFFDDSGRRMYYSVTGNLSDRLTDEHHNKVAREFVGALIERTWSWVPEMRFSRESQLEDEKTAAMFTAARPQYIGLLHQIGELNFVLRRFKEFDGACRKKLLELALCKGSSSPYKTIEQAAHAGNVAARIFIVMRSLLEEERRLKAIRDAEHKKLEAENKLRAARNR